MKTCWQYVTPKHSRRSLTQLHFQHPNQCHTQMKAPIILCISISSGMIEGSSFNASYDPTYGAPRCQDPTSLCDTGTLLVGAGHPSEGGSELNAYNTIDGCFDSKNMTHEVDESVDRIVIRSIDGNVFTVGREINIEANVFTGVNTTEGRAPYGGNWVHFFHTANRDAKWTFIASVWPYQTIFIRVGKRGYKTVHLNYTLPEGDVQAIRVKFGYEQTLYVVGPCMNENGLTDFDDVVFHVNPAKDSPTMMPSASPITQSPTKEVQYTGQPSSMLSVTPTESKVPPESSAPSAADERTNQPSLSPMTLNQVPTYMPIEEHEESEWWSSWWPFNPTSSSRQQLLSCVAWLYVIIPLLITLVMW